jgi:glycerol-3-phosphate acyltransferase PlsY
MENLISYAVIFICVYLQGSIPWGLLVGFMKGVDIRQHGSGNIGATNVNRVLGKKYGRICFFLDFLKGLLPVLIVSILVSRNIIPDQHQLAVPIAALACVAGHIWSIFLKFKGGKGISTSAGALLAIAPYSLILAGIIWAAVFYAMRYVSLASICAAVSLPITAVVFRQAGLYNLTHPETVLITVVAFLAVVKHSSNIKRLVNGSENRFAKKDEKKVEEDKK